MGTTAEVHLVAESEEWARELFEVVFEEIESVEDDLSTYRSWSEISRLNRLAATTATTTDPQVFDLLAYCLDLSRRTQGAFDVTVGPLTKAWGFLRSSGRYPTDQQLRRAREATGWRHLALDRDSRTVRFLRPGMALDLGAVGKGFALDAVANRLQSLGVASALVGLGRSSYYGLGGPPGEPGWRVEVRSPFDPKTLLSTARLRDQALSTSGDSQSFFELEGRRYAHILDPRTGHPVQGMAQTTVIAATAAESDALSTALFVLGLERGASLAEESSAAALLVGRPQWPERIIGLDWPAAILGPAG